MSRNNIFANIFELNTLYIGFLLEKIVLMLQVDHFNLESWCDPWTKNLSSPFIPHHTIT